MNFRTIILAACVVAVVSPAAWAHPWHAPTQSNALVEGWWHVWMGLDHLLAIVAVGLIAARRGGRALWLVPSVYVACLVAGGAAAFVSIGVPWNEFAIALSVVVLGALLAIERKYHVGATASILGAFAVLHGNAHAIELPDSAAPALYAVGLAMATAAGHLAGITAGMCAKRRAASTTVWRLAGAAVAGAGLMCLVGAM
jgi:urease accessory protein